MGERDVSRKSIHAGDLAARRVRIMAVKENHGPFGKLNFNGSRAESGVTA
jgi:hypothetical protein